MVVRQAGHSAVDKGCRNLAVDCREVRRELVNSNVEHLVEVEGFVGSAARKAVEVRILEQKEALEAHPEADSQLAAPVVVHHKEAVVVAELDTFGVKIVGDGSGIVVGTEVATWRIREALHSLGGL